MAKFIIKSKNTRSPFKDKPINVLNLEAPKPKQANDMEEWEQFIRRSINFFYRCNAVKSVKFNKNGSATHSWKICLHTGNNPHWLKQHLEELKRRIRLGRERDKFYGRVTITAHYD